MIRAQGGDPAVCDDVGRLPQAAVIRQVYCGREGYLRRMDTTALGLAAQALGAGRLRKGDPIDYAVGFVLQARVGDRVEPGTPLCQVHARTEEDAARAENAIREAMTWSEAPCEKAKNFYALVSAEGVTEL